MRLLFFSAHENSETVCIFISTVYLTTIVTRFFDENDIFIRLESSIRAVQDGYSIFDVRKL